MGNNLTTEQIDKLRSGRAICNDAYYEHAEGCASKAIWGTSRSSTTGWKEKNKFFDFGGPIDVPTSAVEEMMRKQHATEMYDEFMAALYAVKTSSMKACWQWRNRILAIREQFLPRFFAAGIDLWLCSEHCSEYGCDEYWVLFVDRSVAPANVKESIAWWHLLWWSKQEAHDPKGMTDIQEANELLLSADFKAQM